MDEIPVFDGQSSDRQALVTCGQFISLIDEYALNQCLPENQIKELCQSKVSGDALEFLSSNIQETWANLKSLLLKRYSVKLSIREKVELRKNLKQEEAENVEDFYHRCLQAQFLVSDDVRDVAFEREVLLHFIVGLLPFIQDAVLTSSFTSIDGYIEEAKKHFAVPKAEYFEPNVKLEPWEDYNDLDFNAQFEDYPDQNDNEPDNVKFDPDFDDEDPSKYDDSQDFSDDSLPLKRKKTAKIKKKSSQSKESDIEKKVKCSLCDKTFRTPKGREKHVKTHHKDAEKSCDICQEVFPEIFALARHTVSSHCKKQGNKFVCLYCDSFQRVQSTDVRNHILAVHWQQDNIYVSCEECQKVFEKPYMLHHHVKIFHKKERPFQCDRCPKAFAVPFALKNHIMVHHETPTESKCDQCDKVFNNIVHLKTHINMQHRAVPNSFVCETCGKNFKSKGTLVQHCQSRHQTPEEKDKMKIPCSFPGCTYKGLWQNHVKKHYRLVHLKQKNHACEHCNKPFDSKRRLEEHINGKHLGLKPLQCDLSQCEFATAYSSILAEHKKVAHGNQKFECPYCNHVARYKNNLQKHINNVHQKLK